MKRRSTRKPPQQPLLSSPPPSKPVLSPVNSPAIDFDFNRFNDDDEFAPKTKTGVSSASKLINTATVSSPNQESVKTATSVSDLKDLASSNVESVNRRLQRSHSEILKDIQASQCRLQKRYKMQSEACKKVMDEAEKEYKKISGRIDEGRSAMKASYAEFMVEVQASSSRLCKTSIPELSQTAEKSLAALRSRYGIS